MTPRRTEGAASVIIELNVRTDLARKFAGERDGGQGRRKSAREGKRIDRPRGRALLDECMHDHAIVRAPATTGRFSRCGAGIERNARLWLALGGAALGLAGAAPGTSPNRFPRMMRDRVVRQVRALE